jgi:hypothetical protein
MECKLMPAVLQPDGSFLYYSPQAFAEIEIEAALNRLRIHGRIIDYPGGEIGFERDARLAASIPPLPKDPSHD